MGLSGEYASLVVIASSVVRLRTGSMKYPSDEGKTSRQVGDAREVEDADLLG